MKVQLKNAQPSAEIQLSDAAFGRVYNEALVHQVVTAYMAAGRSGTKAQKTRAEVRGGGKKPWSQKGTGQARAVRFAAPFGWAADGHSQPSPRDFSQKGQSQDVPRCHANHGVAAGAPKTGLVAVESIEFDGA